MTHYYIDGYNLIFRLLSANDKDLRSQREKMIMHLNEMAVILDLDITVIFDAQYQTDESKRSHYDRLEILFTSFGETADEAILNEVKAELSPRHVTVVTSDKKLAWFARRCSAKTETVEEFNHWIKLRYRNKLRLAKNPPNPKAALITAKKPLLEEPTPPLLPVPESSADECFNYYLTCFEKEFNEWSAQEEQKKSERKQTKKSHALDKTKQKKDTKNVKDDGLSDVQRWMRAFQRNLSADEE